MTRHLRTLWDILEHQETFFYIHMSFDVKKCLLMSGDVPECLSMSVDITKYLLNYLNVIRYLKTDTLKFQMLKNFNQLLNCSHR